MNWNPSYRLDDCVSAVIVVVAFASVVGLNAAVVHGAVLGRDASVSEAQRVAAQKKEPLIVETAAASRLARRTRG